MPRKKYNNPYACVDGKESNKPFTIISEKQFNSPAYRDLSGGAKNVLIACKLCRQYHTGKDKDGKSRAIDGDLLKFYFNRAIQKQYGLNDPNQVRKWLIELIKKGFIDVEENGWNTRTKDIYKFSDKWQYIEKGQEVELSERAKSFVTGRPEMKKPTGRKQKNFTKENNE